jgi:glycosyltransferase involved in cell wall biosynthesis
MSHITCVLSAVLGNRIFSARLADAVDRCSGPSERLWFDAGVYRRYPAPRWMQHLSVYESEWVARRWLREKQISGPVVVNGFTCALAGAWPHMIVATDITPAVRWNGSLKRRMVMSPVSLRFRHLASRVAAWLPMSATAAQSLIEDYGVAPERCFVTRAPQPVIDPRPHAPRGEILFVGNDFRRKGGFELLEAFARNLLPECRLVIVSNDPALDGIELPPGVRWLAGVHDPGELDDVYHAADLLVLPTRFDCYSQVVCEAAAHGVPALATRVGGVGELIDESGGWSLPAGCHADDIAAGIRDALDHDYAEHAESAARFAREKLSLSVFDAAVTRALEQL